jgi:hypothetical protein
MSMGIGEIVGCCGQTRPEFRVVQVMLSVVRNNKVIKLFVTAVVGEAHKLVGQQFTLGDSMKVNL